MTRVRVMINGVPAVLFFSGTSNVNVLKPEVASRAGLSIIKLEQPIQVSFGAIFGEPAHPVRHKTAVPYQSNGFVAQDDFYVSPDFASEECDGVMGRDWALKYGAMQSFGSDVELVARDLAGNKQALDCIPYEFPKNGAPDGVFWYMGATRLD